MNIYFKQLQSEGRIELNDVKIDVSELLTTRNDIESVQPVNMSIVATASDDTVYVTGKGKATAQMLCSRCLDQFEQTIDIDFKEAFSQNEDVVDADEDEETLLIEEDFIDLLPVIEENIVLAFPFIPLCKDDCLGLCAICGRDQNEEQCHCQDDVIDPRLEGLKAFFD